MDQTKQKKTTEFRDWEYILNSYTWEWRNRTSDP